MLLTVKSKLVTDKEQHDKLLKTMEKTEPLEIWMPTSAKIALGIEAVKLETSLSELVRAVLKLSLDSNAQYLYLPALPNEDLVRLSVRVQKPTKRTLESLSDYFAIPVQAIARGVLITYCDGVLGQRIESERAKLKLDISH